MSAGNGNNFRTDEGNGPTDRQTNIKLEISSYVDT